MLKQSVNFFDNLMSKYTPDPFLFAIVITIITLMMGSMITNSTFYDLISIWGKSFWNLSTFILQMVMVLIGGYVLAIAAPVQNILSKIVAQAKTTAQGIIITTIIALLASAINWGLGLVVGGLVCKEMKKVLPNINYRLLVASSYSGFIVWHGGISASIPLLLATAKNFTEELIGGTIPISHTLLSTVNLFAVIGIFIILPITNWYLNKISKIKASHNLKWQSESEYQELQNIFKDTPAAKLEKSKTISLVIGIIGLVYIVTNIRISKINLHDLNFIFLFLGIFLHRTPRNFLKAFNTAATKSGPILLQFPFYAGIMGMLSNSQLGEKISSIFMKISTIDTFYFFTFLSAGLLNLFVPSGGGQWAIQGPIVIQAAQNIGADIAIAAVAVAWGDAWTNLLQPFWALPLLAIAGLNVRDIMGYCVTILCVTGIFLSLVFLFLT